MRAIGAVLLVVGLLVGLYSCTMETTVTTEPVEIDGEYFGGGEEVYNVGLQAEQRNTLIAAGILALLGGVLVAGGSRVERSPYHETTPDGPTSGTSSRKCPQCAEFIMREARVCRFCGYDMAPILAEEQRRQAEAGEAAAARLREKEEADRTYMAEQRERQARVAAHKRAQRVAWREAHPAIGWIPARSNAQVVVYVAACTVLITALVVTSAQVTKVRDERRKVRDERRLVADAALRAGALAGSWNVRGDSGHIEFRSDQDTQGLAELVILPRGSGSGQYRYARYGLPASGVLEVTEDTGSTSQLRYTVSEDGVLTITPAKSEDSAPSPLALSICTVFER